METITSRNPLSGSVIKEFDQTPIELIPQIIERARDAQKSWQLLTVKKRCEYMFHAKEYILDHIEEIADVISSENGKPKFEAIITDILGGLDIISNFAKRGPKLLSKKRLSPRWAKYRSGYFQYWPKGVVCVISPWNFPFSIPFGEIVMALIAGNAVVLKPSEVTTLVGMKILEIFENAGLPKNLLQLVIGDGKRGAAIIKAKVDQICFTGSVPTGKKVMAAASENLTPFVLELGGKDAMIVLKDANLDYATSAALWGGFANSGQACASVERVIIHESIHDTFVEQLKFKLSKLRHNSNLSETDFGVATYEQQKSVYQSQLSELNNNNSTVVCGGKFNSENTYLEPTIITNPLNATPCPIENTKIYQEETFGPVVVVTKYRSIEEAIEKANNSRYGLLASIIGSNISLAEEIAQKLEVGSVLINEVLYTHALSEAPWGGVKETGIGRVHSDAGLYEFVNIKHIDKPGMFTPLFKSFWWFPYTKHQYAMFKLFGEFMYRRSIFRRLAALPHMLVEFVNMLKNEKRL